MPRVSLETKKVTNTTHASLASVLLVLVLVAFGYWCHYVNEMRKIEDSGNAPTTLTIFATDQAANRDTVFQAAVVGFLLIITVKHLRDLLYHM